MDDEASRYAEVLAEHAQEAHADPEVQSKFENQGMEATGITGPEKLSADIKTQIERWRKIVDETGFKAD